MSARSATTGPGLPPLSADHAGERDFVSDLIKSKRAQVLRDQFAGAEFTIAEFRVGVNIAPPGDQPALDRIGKFGNAGIECAGCDGRGMGGVHGNSRGANGEIDDYRISASPPACRARKNTCKTMKWQV